MKHRAARRRPRWVLTLAATSAVALGVLLVPGNIPGAAPTSSGPGPAAPATQLHGYTATATGSSERDRMTPFPPRLQMSAPPARTDLARIPLKGTGDFRVASAPRGEASDAEVMTYTVEVEGGLSLPVAAAARLIDATLSSSRGWTTATGVGFQRVGATADLRVVIASPDTTDALCAPLLTRGRVSCRNGGLVVLNARRWVSGTPEYRGFLRQYQHYVVNHEVGHALGYPHVSCPSNGSPAPVMAQQTYGLDGCARNAWPSTTG